MAIVLIDDDDDDDDDEAADEEHEQNDEDGHGHTIPAPFDRQGGRRMGIDGC